MNYSIKKINLAYYILLLGLYLSIFLPIIRGLFRKIDHSVEIIVQVVAQSLIYFPPILIFFFINSNNLRTFFIIIILIYICFVQFFTPYFLVSDLFFGIKNYFGSLLYIPIVHYLIINYQNFNIKIEKHIKIIFIITVSIILFETIAPDSLNNLFRSLAYNDQFTRSLGIMLNVHHQGLILGMAVIYYFINKRFFLVILTLILLILSNVKTWTIALAITAVLYFIKDILKIKIKIIFLILILAVGLFLFYLIGFFDSVISHYLGAFGAKSYSIDLMTSLWLETIDIISNSLIPIGFFSQAEQTGYGGYSEYMTYADVFYLLLILETGVIGAFLYFLIVYYPLLKKNKYSPIVFLSLFSMLHTNPLIVPGILIMVTYFGYYYKYHKF